MLTQYGCGEAALIYKVNFLTGMNNDYDGETGKWVLLCCQNTLTRVTVLSQGYTSNDPVKTLHT